jgi:transcriptional regulator with XRE-family HTH domain
MDKSIYTIEYKVFSNLLIECREKKGLLQEELAKRLNTSRTQISRYENGLIRLDIVQIHHYLTALDITLQEFIEEYLKRIKR